MAAARGRLEGVTTVVTGVLAVALLGHFAWQSLHAPRMRSARGALRIAERGSAPEPGVVIEGARVTPYPTARGEALVLRGWLRNDTSARRPMPALRMTLLGAQGKAAQHAPIVARTPPELCELAHALQSSAPEALSELLVPDSALHGSLQAHGRTPIFAVVSGYERAAGPAWVTLDWQRP